MTFYAVKVDASVISRDLQLLNYRDLGFFRVSQKLNVIVVLMQTTRAARRLFLVSSALYTVQRGFSKICPHSCNWDSRVVPTIPGRWQRIGRDCFGVEFKSVLTWIAHEYKIAPSALSKVQMQHFSLNAEALEVEKGRQSFEGHSTIFVCFENT